MPKKQVQTPTFKGFINYNLTPQEKAFLKGRPFHLDDVENTLVQLTENNYKVTFSWDDYNKCYSCFLAHKDAKHNNAGYILAGKGSTPVKALKQAAFVHYEIFREDWPDTNRPVEEIDD